MVAAAGGAQRRRRAAAQTAGAPAPGQADTGMLRFNSEEAQGLKIGPTTVLVISLLFIGSVVLLHIFGKVTK